jgi:hypothetical protein
VQKSVKDREKRDGVTVDEMTIEVNRAHQALEKTKTELGSMDALTRVRLCLSALAARAC